MSTGSKGLADEKRAARERSESEKTHLAYRAHQRVSAALDLSNLQSASDEMRRAIENLDEESTRRVKEIDDLQQRNLEKAASTAAKVWLSLPHPEDAAQREAAQKVAASGEQVILSRARLANLKADRVKIRVVMRAC